MAAGRGAGRELPGRRRGGLEVEAVPGACRARREGVAAGEASVAIRRRRGGRDWRSRGSERQRLPPAPSRCHASRVHVPAPRPVCRRVRAAAGPDPGAQCPAGPARCREGAARGRGAEEAGRGSGPVGRRARGAPPLVAATGRAAGPGARAGRSEARLLRILFQNTAPRFRSAVNTGREEPLAPGGRGSEAEVGRARRQPGWVLPCARGYF